MRPRYTLLDLLRILASISIVSYHVRGTSVFGIGFGLPLFLILMFALAASSRRCESLPRFARRKARHLLSPWLRWSALFLVLFAVRDLHWGVEPARRYTLHAVFYGGHMYYWFLPFAAGVVVLARLVGRMARRFDPGRAALALGAGGALATLAVHATIAAHAMPHPYHGWLHGLPALCYGPAVGQILRLPEARMRARTFGWLVSLALAAAVLDPIATPGVEWRYAVAVPLAAVGFVWRPRLPRVVPAIATTCFGIYLAHPLAMVGWRQIADPSGWSALTHVAVVWTTSMLLVLALRRIRPRWQEAGRPAPPAPVLQTPRAPEHSRAA